MRPYLLLALLLPALLLASAATPAAAQTCGDTYTVLEGDTLWSIAEKCGVKYLVIIGLNFQLSSPDRIWPGQVIRLEAEAELPTPEGPQKRVNSGLEGGSTYVVRPGDSLARVALIYDTTPDILHELNPELGGSDVIRTGQVIQLPYDARENRGWVGVSLLEVTRSQRLRVRVLGFHPNGEIEFFLHRKDTTVGVRVKVRANPRGEARALMTVPSTAFRGDTWVVEAYTVNDPDEIREFSPEITIR